MRATCRAGAAWSTGRACWRDVEADIERAGFVGLLDPATLGRDLSPAQRQMVEILRALAGNPRVIAFDEPTSSLSDHEAEQLFNLIRRLAASGIAIIYVSHRLREIFDIATRVLVLRDGLVVGERRVADTDQAELVRMMVGRDLTSLFQHTTHELGRVVLSLRNVTSADVENVSFDVRAGEVVVLAGLVGAGRTELARAIMGDLPITGGEIYVEDERMMTVFAARCDPRRPLSGTRGAQDPGAADEALHSRQHFAGHHQPAQPFPCRSPQ